MVQTTILQIASSSTTYQVASITPSLGYEVLKLVVGATITLIVFPFIIWILKEFFTKHFLTIKEIKKVTDADIEEFKSLYIGSIPQEFQIDPEEILGYIGKQPNGEVQHHLIVCKSAFKVVGFIKFMICYNPKYLFIAYIAVDNTHKKASKNAVSSLLKRVAKKYVKKYDIPYIISEVKRCNDLRNNSLARNFARHAKIFGKRAYILDFDYIQPKMPNEMNNETEERFLSLLVVPSYEIEYPKIEKDVLIKIIKSIYYKIYFPSCNSLGGSEAYENYLDDLIQLYDSIKENVPMIVIG